MSNTSPMVSAAHTRGEEQRHAADKPAAIVLLILGLGITTLAWLQTSRNEQARIDQQFEAMTFDVRDRLQVRLLEHELMLRGAHGHDRRGGPHPDPA
jgi:hypothetical protein